MNRRLAPRKWFGGSKQRPERGDSDVGIPQSGVGPGALPFMPSAAPGPEPETGDRITDNRARRAWTITGYIYPNALRAVPATVPRVVGLRRRCSVWPAVVGERWWEKQCESNVKGLKLAGKQNRNEDQNHAQSNQKESQNGAETVPKRSRNHKKS